MIKLNYKESFSVNGIDITIGRITGYQSEDGKDSIYQYTAKCSTFDTPIEVFGESKNICIEKIFHQITSIFYEYKDALLDSLDKKEIFNKDIK